MIDFSKLINSLLRQKWLIVTSTSIITLLVVLYLLTLKPLFIVSASVISPNAISIVKLNGYSLEEIEREEVFRTFLNKSLTSELQIKVFKENNFLSRLNPLDEPIEDLNAYMKNFTQTIELLSPEQNKSSLNEAPHIYSVRGSNPELIVDFLDNLISPDRSANKKDGDIIEFNELWGEVVQQLLFIFFIHYDSMMTGRTEEIIRIGIISTGSTFFS